MVNSPLPQPWDWSDLTESEYAEWAFAQERGGKRLVVESLVNGYLSYDGEWFADLIVLTDFRTGEQLFAYDPFESEPEFEYMDAVVVHRRLSA